MRRDWEVELYCDGDGEHRPVVLAVPMRDIREDGEVHDHYRTTKTAMFPMADAPEGGPSRNAYAIQCTRCSLDWRPVPEKFWTAIRALAAAGVSRVDARALMRYSGSQKP